MKAALTSVAVNVGLLTVKSAVALLTGSVALWASAADSLLDLTASGFALLGVTVAARPPDDTHAYGHDKFESMSSLVQLGLLLAAVAGIATASFRRFGGLPTVVLPAAGVAVVVFSLLVDAWVARRLLRAADATGGSQALEADALHFSSDLLSNVAVIVGLVAAGAGYPVADPVAGLVVAAVVTVTAVGLLRRTVRALTDRAPDETVVRRIDEVLTSFDRVHAYHTLRARLVGRRIFLDVCVELDPDLTFRRAHDLAHEMQDALHAAVPAIADAVIHYEPVGHPPHQDRHHDHGMHALTVEDEAATAR